MNKKIYITTDIHNFMHYSEEHKKWFFDETEHLKKYLKLAKKYNIKTTVFVTGKILEEKLDEYKWLLNDFDIEIGGHTYDCFTQYFKWEWFLYKKIFWCSYWPKIFQKKDIEKTTKIINKLWIKPVSWRTHAYASNFSTREVLKSNGYKIISDVTTKKYSIEDFIDFPPNTLPDHENIIHDWIKNNSQAKYTVKEWLKEIKKEVKKQRESVILAHATCHAYLDNFKILEELFNWIDKNNYETVFMKNKVWIK